MSHKPTAVPRTPAANARPKRSRMVFAAAIQILIRRRRCGSSKTLSCSMLLSSWVFALRQRSPIKSGLPTPGKEIFTSSSQSAIDQCTIDFSGHAQELCLLHTHLSRITHSIQHLCVTSAATGDRVSGRCSSRIVCCLLLLLVVGNVASERSLAASWISERNYPLLAM